jgi:uncharacterized repeat protein (TIGR02543 family)
MLCVILTLCVFTFACKKKSYKIEYVVNGGNLPTEYASTYQQGTGATLPSPTKDGNTFAGWYASADFSGSKVTSVTTSDKGDKKFYAKWTSSVTTYTITYVLNAGTNATNAPTTYTAGKEVTLPAPTKSGSVFAGWYTSSDFAGNAVTKVASTETGNKTFYAKWTEAVGNAINYTLNDGTLSGTYPTVVAENESVTLPTPTRSGYSFVGWYLEADFSGEKVTSITGGTTAVNVYAKWEEVAGDLLTITYVLGGGELTGDYPTTFKAGSTVVLPTPTREDYSFAGWFTTADFSGETVTTFSGKMENQKFYAKWISSGSVQEYQPKFALNTLDFNGKGMTVAIKVLPVSEFDPYDSGYSGKKKALIQKHQRMVEDAFNIVIKWSAWDDSAPWGPERVKFIKTSYLDGSFSDNDVYIVNIVNNWIPTLIQSDCLAVLSNTDNSEGSFSMVPNQTGEGTGYEQDLTLNDASSVKGSVYGYTSGVVRPDYFIYYNADLAAKYGLADPAEMWFMGTWTMSNFEAWVAKAQVALASEAAKCYAVDFGSAEYTIAMTAAQGGQMVKQTPANVLFTRPSVTDVFGEAQKLYAQNCWNKGHGTNDVSSEFLAGNTILTSGELWFLKDDTRFDPGKITFEIGCVPYPTADGQGGEPIITEDPEEAIMTRNNKPLTNDAGEYISGVDMSGSSFQVPYASGSCYSVMNIGNNGKNGITSDNAFEIIYDLQSGVGADPQDVAAGIEMTDDEGYEVYLAARFDHQIYVDTIMSVQQNTYFEMIELLSMTVGGGSHFGPDAFWPLAQGIVSNNSVNAATKLNEVLEKYKQALRDIGYIVQ